MEVFQVGKYDHICILSPDGLGTGAVLGSVLPAATGSSPPALQVELTSTGV